MNAKTNKLLVFVLALAMTVGLFSGVALATEATGSIVCNGTSYTTIAEAIEKGNGAEIKVTENHSEDVVIPKEKTITLNIADGVTLTSNGSHTIANHGTLTITGSGTIENTKGSKGALANYPTGKLTLDGCTVTGSTWYVIKNLGTMVINSGATMEQKDAGSSAIANGYNGGSGDLDCVITGNPTPTLTINGGSFSGGMNIVKNDEWAELEINDGTFYNEDGPAVMNWSKAVINGGKFELGNVAKPVISIGYYPPSGAGILTVKGGTFTAANGGKGSILGYGIGSSTGGSTTFEGGTFNGVLNADNYPNTPIVLPGATINAPAGDTSADQYKAKFEVNGKYYTTLGDAVAAVPANGTQTTIKLLCDATGGGAVVKAGQNIVFDFGGHTYTVGSPTVGSTGTETNGFQLLKGSNVTMKNGTVKASTYKDLMILIQNYCGVRLENVTLDASGAPQCQYVLSNNCGNTVITGNTQILAAPGQKAFDLWYGMHENYKDGVTVTFDKGFTGRVEGIVEYGAKNTWDHWVDKTVLTMANGNAGKFDIKIKAGSTNFDLNTANVKIAGGSFTNKVNEKYLADGFTLKQNSDGSYTVAPVTPNVPKTGDSSMPMLWLALMLLGAAGLAVLCKKARKA